MGELTNDERERIISLEKRGYFKRDFNEGIWFEIFNSQMGLIPLDELESIFSGSLEFGSSQQIKYKEAYEYYSLIHKRDFTFS
ncbi:hypothetical protein J4474_04550 [Candidatus Pacearchaeota archaeon]|nr:hypothetical protein [Candidatus Pacearchaeota archaeon]